MGCECVWCVCCKGEAVINRRQPLQPCLWKQEARKTYGAGHAGAEQARPAGGGLPDAEQTALPASLVMSAF